jgi:hypothetical protein
VLGSIRTPIDFLGTMFPRKMRLDPSSQHLSPDGDSEMLYTHYAPAGFAVRAALAQRALIVFDEANTCAMSTQAALLRVLFEGMVGEMPMPLGVRMMLAMNPIKMSAGGRQISMPLSNRLGWIDWPAPTVENFTRFLLTGGQVGQFMNPEGDIDARPIDPAHEEALVDARWDRQWALSLGTITGFLKRRPDLLYKPAREGGVPWESPRTWELAARAITGSRIYGLSQTEERIAVAAYVGVGTFNEFWQWRKEADLPDPERLLDGEAQFVHNRARPDKTAAVLTSCSAIVLPEKSKMRPERAKALWRIIKDIADDATDICVPTVVAMCQNRLVAGNTDAYRVLAKMEPVMSAAGISKSIAT